MVTDEQKIKASKLYDKCKDGIAPSHEVKAELIELYNEIYNTKYKTNTNCGACLKAVFNGIKNIAIGKMI